MSAENAGVAEQRLLERVWNARRALRSHSEDCALWDYASNNGCEACDRLEAQLDAARDRLREHRATLPR